MAGDIAFDVSEMSTSELISRHLAGNSPFVALPVFPSRVFRHGFIYVNTDSGITSPKQLAGKRIGVPLYGMSAALWIRGTLADEYGADWSDVTWVQGSMTGPGTHGTPALIPLARPVRIEQNSSAKSLSALLADGEIDALMSSRIVDGLGSNPKLRRLIANHREVEKDYFRRTGIFPIMHSVAIRREVHEANPWIAQSLYDAFCQAKQRALALMREVGSLKYMLPWLPDDLDEIREVFGGDPWPYGIERNRKVLETAVRYLSEQGLTDRTAPVDDLYIKVDETLS